jgi:hypothetical protein
VEWVRNRWKTFVIATPPIAAAFGALISTIYLGQYELASVSVLNVRILYTGGFFLLLLFGVVIVNLAYVNIDESDARTLVGILGGAPIKLCLVTLIIFAASTGTLAPGRIGDREVDHVFARSLAFALALPALGIMGAYPFFRDSQQKHTRLQYYFMGTLTLYGAVLLAGTILLSVAVEPFRHVMSFVATITMFVTTILVIRWAELNDKSRGVGPFSPDVHGRGIVGKPRLLGAFYGLLLVGFWLLLLLSTYSRNVYPIVRQEFGGGYSPTVVIALNHGEDVTGRVVHMTDDRLILVPPNDNALVVVRWDDIREARRADALLSTQPSAPYLDAP